VFLYKWVSKSQREVETAQPTLKQLSCGQDPPAPARGCKVKENESMPARLSDVGASRQDEQLPMSGFVLNFVLFSHGGGVLLV
jgi:hypothetical protein